MAGIRLDFRGRHARFQHRASDAALEYSADGTVFQEMLLAGGTRGTTYYVKPAISASGTGKSWGEAFKTMAEALDAAVAGDTIFVTGTVSEDTLTADVAGLSIIGVGNGPAGAVWQASAAGATPDVDLLTLAAANIRVEGIKFRPPAYSAVRNIAAIVLSGANYAQITGCRFQGMAGSQNAIYSPVANSDNVQITGNEFIYMNTATYGTAVKGAEAGGLSYSGWTVADNVFNSCVVAVNICGRVCQVYDNTVDVVGITAASAVGTVCTLGIDLSGTGSGGNQVHRNFLNGAYTATLYKVGASGDDWAGNYAIGGGTGVAAGVTTANPA